MRADPKKRTMGAWLAEEIAGPLGCDVFCGPHHPGWLEKPRALMKGVPDEAVFNFVTEIVPSAVRATCTDKYPWLEPPVGIDRGAMRDFMKGECTAVVAVACIWILNAVTQRCVDSAQGRT